VLTLQYLERGYYPTKKEGLLLTKGGSLLSHDASAHRADLKAWLAGHYDGITSANFDTLLEREEDIISRGLAALKRFDTEEERTRYWAEKHLKGAPGEVVDSFVAGTSFFHLGRGTILPTDALGFLLAAHGFTEITLVPSVSMLAAFNKNHDVNFMSITIVKAREQDRPPDEEGREYEGFVLNPYPGATKIPLQLLFQMVHEAGGYINHGAYTPRGANRKEIAKTVRNLSAILQIEELVGEYNKAGDVTSAFGVYRGIERRTIEFRMPGNYRNLIRRSF